ncbi:hypothetical protein Q2T41_10130 [Maribacter confluentis]|uniref:STAS/SEC14 domain-containing protein n=1 Tax=Maribacter confluentis TaxID=1656093 RepID=A0ABT8RR65_9FLAO|nr:hypothetical protein [Maribacter confluentis]MDO1513012.1 hypothetical protein [Maribacter confluentis]
MKRVKEHNIYNSIREIREFDFGVFYFFTGGIIISEMNEGVLFKWKDALKIVHAAEEIYGLEIPIIYVANRINSYYVVPSNWVMFYRNRTKMAHYGVVGQTRGSFASILLEKLFFKNSLVQFKNLDHATTWAKNISEKALWPDKG